MKSVIVGTAGHIDHCKTALVKALTGIDADRLEEEKRRGITIDLGFAFLPIAGKTLGFIDVPGHERLVHTMLAGASGIDFALLAVAADDWRFEQFRPLGICATAAEVLRETSSEICGRSGNFRPPSRILDQGGEILPPRSTAPFSSVLRH